MNVIFSTSRKYFDHHEGVDNDEIDFVIRVCGRHLVLKIYMDTQKAGCRVFRCT